MAGDSAPHFFDITSTLSGPSKSWSPNTLRTRAVLNFKGVHYTQSFISYPDIRGLLQGLSVPALSGRFEYSLPAIVHRASIPPSVNPHGAMNESFAIALHLEEAYPAPEYPSLFPSAGSYALALAVKNILDSCIMGAPIMIPKVVNFLDERGAEYFRRTRESPQLFGKPLSEVLAGEGELESAWKTQIRSFELLAKMLSGREGSAEAKGPFFEGDKAGYADLMVASFLAWYERIDRADWERLMGVGEGELRRLWDACLPWVNGQGEEKEFKTSNL